MEVVVTTGLLELLVVQSSNQITTNKPRSSFLQAGCPSCRPTNSVKALKGKISHSMDMLTPSSPGVFQLCLLPLSKHNYEETIATLTWTVVTATRQSWHLCPTLSVLTAFSRYGTGLADTRIYPFWIVLALRMMNVVMTSGVIYKTCRAPVKSLPTNQ